MFVGKVKIVRHEWRKEGRKEGMNEWMNDRVGWPCCDWRDGRPKRKNLAKFWQLKVSIDTQVAQVICHASCVFSYKVFLVKLKFHLLSNKKSHHTVLLYHFLFTFFISVFSPLHSFVCAMDDREQRPPTAPRVAPIPVALGTLRPQKMTSQSSSAEQKTWMIDTQPLFCLK